MELLFISQDGTHYSCEVQPTTSFAEILNTYFFTCEGHALVFDGQRINLEQTPNDYKMENGNMIDLFTY